MTDRASCCKSFVALTAALLLATHSAFAAPPTRAIEGRALDAAPESRVEAAQTIDAAVAAALIGAISTQFGERKVEVKLDRMQVDPANAAGTSQHNGKTYYFCSTSCKARFDANPGQYVR